MKRVLTYVLLLGAVLSIGSASAYFTAQAELKDNVISGGTLKVSVEPTSSALSIDQLAPGETLSKTVRIRNTGTVGCQAVTSAAKKAGITDFWTALQCRVTCDGAELYSGPLATLRSAPVRIDPGQSVQVTYAIGLPSDAGNDLQGDYVRASLYVDAEQLR